MGHRIPFRARLGLVVAGAVALALTVCACRPASDALAPPEIHYGEDVCAECGMILSDPRFAASVVVGTPSEPRAVIFDDIGDMFDYAHKHPELTVLKWYVHDYDTQAWLPAEAATFIQSNALHTPMGHGLAAFSDPAHAAKMAAESHGKTVAFDALRGAGPNQPVPSQP
jgi:copper chaperone NosL